MPQLIAKVLTQEDELEQVLTQGQVVRIGRKPADGWPVGWDKQISREQLNALPDDGAKEFLINHMADFNNEPPTDWDGAFSLAKK